MATIPNAMLLAASSPYARRGELYRAFREHHAIDDAPALVWRAATRTMNPSVPQSFIDRETERDPASAAAEYGAEFRTDIESYISPEVVESVTMPGRHELPPMSGIVYSAFIDPSGGSGQDSMTLAICHRDKSGTAILDAIRERRPPFSPEVVTNEFASLLKTYRITKVTGDRFAGEWPREQLRKRGIAYDVAEHPKSQIYLEALPALNSGKVELLDHPRLTAQLCGLERRTARGGKGFHRPRAGRARRRRQRRAGRAAAGRDRRQGHEDLRRHAAPRLDARPLYAEGIMTIRKNYEYLIWAITVGAAQGDLAALRAEWKAALRADGAEPEPTSGSSWLSNITQSMVDRASRKPTANIAHRAELLHGRTGPSTVDTSGAVDYGTFIEKGFNR
jgi:hypothetical protein